MSEVQPSRPRLFWWSALGVLVVSAGFVTWMQLTLGGDDVSTAVDDITEMISAVLAAGLCALVALRGPHRLRWWGLSLGSLSWAVGQSWYVVDEVFRGTEVPSPALDDVFFLAFAPLAAVGLLSFLRTPAGARSQLRSLVDALLLGGGAFLCAWPTVVQPLLATADSGAAAQTVAVLYPMTDLVLVGLVAFALTRSHGSRRSTVALVGAGLVAFAFADTGFAYLTQVKDLANATDIAVGWVGGFLLIALAALRELTSPPVQGERRTQRQVSSFLPYAFVLAGVAVAGGVVAARGHLDTVSLCLAGGLITLLVADQWSVVRDNDSLTTHLEGLVAQRTAQLEENSRRHRALVQNASDVLTVVDPTLRVIYQSPSGQRLHGLPVDQVIGGFLSELLTPGDAELLAGAIRRSLSRPNVDVTVESAFVDAAGTRRVLDTTVANLMDEPGVGGLLLTTRDVTERVTLQEELTRQAFHDVLTDLPNRALLRDRAEQALRHLERVGAGGVAVLLIDLDDFKSVNDSMGHPAGDVLLVEAGRRLTAAVRVGDTVARLGGDEFAVLLDDVLDASEAFALGERLLQELGPFVEIGGRELRLTASAGIALTTDPSTAVDDLIRDADIAMYAAKATNKGRVSLFDPELQKARADRVELTADLRDAAVRGELFLLFQPVVNLSTQSWIGAEALVRWRHPVRGVVPPLDFIPLAEESGEIVALGRWVLEQSCLQAAQWQREGERFSISVNVSARQLYDPHFRDDVQRSLEASGLPASALVLELTESVLLEDALLGAERLSALKDLGIRIAIDDFGTGYSSMAYLHQLPLDILKIDRSFVSGVCDGGQRATVTRAVADLARSLGLASVAEGVETAEQLLALNELGCDAAQGYYFARPLDPEVLTAQLDEARSQHATA